MNTEEYQRPLELLAQRLDSELAWLARSTGKRPDDIGDPGDAGAKELALGALWGSLDLVVAGKNLLRESITTRKLPVAAFALERPAVEWYLRALWLHQGADQADIEDFVRAAVEEIDEPNYPRLGELRPEVAKRAGGDEAFFTEILGRSAFFNDQVHGGPRPLMESRSARSAPEYREDSRLLEGLGLCGKVAFRVSRMVVLLTDANDELLLEIERRRQGFEEMLERIKKDSMESKQRVRRTGGGNMRKAGGDETSS